MRDLRGVGPQRRNAKGKPKGHERATKRREVWSAVTNHAAPSEDPCPSHSLLANLAKRRNVRKVASVTRTPLRLRPLQMRPPSAARDCRHHGLKNTTEHERLV